MILHSQIIGEGRPFIILHGFLGMGDNWKTLAKKFSGLGYQLHLIDQRNHGRSFHSDQFNYSLMAADLKAYVKFHSLNDIVLLGHSMGGKTAMEYAATNPNSIRKLIVADIGPKAYPMHHQDILKALSSLDFSEIKTRGQAEELLAKYIKEAGTRLFLMKNLYWVEKGQLGLRINLPVLTQHNEEIGRRLSPDHKFDGDTLFARGAKSGYIEAMDEMGILLQFPNASISTINNAGHWLHADNPSDFYNEVAHFLT